MTTEKSIAQSVVYSSGYDLFSKIPLKKILNIENDLNSILSTPQENNLRIVGTYKKCSTVVEGYF